MESLQKSMAQMMEHFNTKMADFQKDLQKASPTPTLKALSTDFVAFKNFVSTMMREFQQQFELLAQQQNRLEIQQDQFEMRGRRKILLLHGVSESPKEDIVSIISGLTANKLKLSNFREDDLCRFHRLGKASRQKPRPILVEFCTLAIKNKFWAAKTQLKGAGVTMSEFLTKGRHDTFMAARESFGVNRCWTRDGYVFVVTPDGVRHHLNSCAEVKHLSLSFSNAETGGGLVAGAISTPKATVVAKK
ncbi:uncharacterized protein LOC132904308 [Amyelois transitella]|uniref:uncharacterized protein LOC132904308 n=1 Tax=Amyelois transitella TaxID=680683 RepID=UPI0029902960|nr:uncharacterized protein LOC132904308 [Amyelois transitella]